MLNLDCKSIKGQDGTTLTGDMAARLLDIVGIVVNANTLPGDKLTAKASGVRMGTPWTTQRGLVESDMRLIADIMADLLNATEPYTVASSGKSQTRVKIPFKVLEDAKIRVRAVIAKCSSQWRNYPDRDILSSHIQMISPLMKRIS